MNESVTYSSSRKTLGRSSLVFRPSSSSLQSSSLAFSCRVFVNGGFEIISFSGIETVAELLSPNTQDNTLQYFSKQCIVHYDP